MARKYELKTGKALDRLISSIAKTATQLTIDIHLACLSAAAHAAEHGNCTPINTLCDVAKDVTHNNGTMRWMDEYCPWVKYSTKDKAFVMNTEFRKAVLDDKGMIDPDVLNEYIDGTLETAKTYLEFTPPPAFVPFNAVAMLMRIVSKAEKMTDEEKADPRNKLDGIDAIRKLAQQLKPAAA